MTAFFNSAQSFQDLSVSQGLEGLHSLLRTTTVVHGVDTADGYLKGIRSLPFESASHLPALSPSSPEGNSEFVTSARVHAARGQLVIS